MKEPAPEITLTDFTRFMQDNKWVVDADTDDWMEINGITVELLSTMSEAMKIAFSIRSIEKASIDSALHQVLCSTFQLGWEASRHFNSNSSSNTTGV